MEEARRKSIVDGLTSDLQDLKGTNAGREEDAVQAAECMSSTLAFPPVPLALLRAASDSVIV